MYLPRNSQEDNSWELDPGYVTSKPYQRLPSDIFLRSVFIILDLIKIACDSAFFSDFCATLYGQNGVVFRLEVHECVCECVSSLRQHMNTMMVYLFPYLYCQNVTR